MLIPPRLRNHQLISKNNSNNKQSKDKKKNKKNTHIPQLSSIINKLTGTLAQQRKPKVLPGLRMAKRDPFSATAADLIPFIAVYHDPFIKTVARLPTEPFEAVDIQRVYASGTFVTNASNIGWVMMKPHGCAFNDTNSIFVSNNGTPDKFDEASATSYAPNSPYTQSDYHDSYMQAKKKYRLVAVGIRVRYQGKVLDAGGNAHCLQVGPDRSLQGMDISAMKKFPGYHSYPLVNKEGGTQPWIVVTRHIESRLDFQFQSVDEQTSRAHYPDLRTTFGGASVGIVESKDSSQRMGIMVQATTPGAMFEWEVVGHFEISGFNLINPKVANNNADEVYAIVHRARDLRNESTTKPDHAHGQTSTSGFWSKAWSTLGKVGSGLLKYGPPVMETILSLL